MLKKIAIGLGVLIVLFCVVVATRPDALHVERSAVINAPADVIFPILNDLRRWPEWSPWEKLDKNIKKEFEGPPSGVGAKYHWVGNEQVGEGRMTIVDVRPNEQVGIKLEFIKPFEAQNTVTFTLKPAPGGTQVTWAMDGKQNFMMKAFGLFMNMDQQIGKDFEEGLQNLKGLAEGAARKAAEEAAKKAAELAASPSPSPAPAAPPPAPPAPAKPAKKKK
jgi:uncharacterized protein YndB with AHSA1/START domain